jgi:hypothetical protein
MADLVLVCPPVVTVACSIVKGHCRSMRLHTAAWRMCTIIQHECFIPTHACNMVRLARDYSKAPRPPLSLLVKLQKLAISTWYRAPASASRSMNGSAMLRHGPLRVQSRFRIQNDCWHHCRSSLRRPSEPWGGRSSCCPSARVGKKPALLHCRPPIH